MTTQNSFTHRLIHEKLSSGKKLTKTEMSLYAGRASPCVAGACGAEPLARMPEKRLTAAL